MTISSSSPSFDLDSMVVAVVAGQEITRSRLAEVFALVEDSSNWKNAIDAYVSHADADRLNITAGLVREAVVFFAGCIPTIEHTVHGLHVMAIGYYAAVGA